MKKLGPNHKDGCDGSSSYLSGATVDWPDRACCHKHIGGPLSVMVVCPICQSNRCSSAEDCEVPCDGPLPPPTLS